MNIAKTFGKAITRDTKTEADDAFQTVLNKTIDIEEVQFPQTMPRGAGNKPWRTDRSEYMPIPHETRDDPNSPYFLDK